MCCPPPYMIKQGQSQFESSLVDQLYIDNMQMTSFCSTIKQYSVLSSVAV